MATSAMGLEFREEPYRVGIIDVGEPILLEYPELTNEMRLNSELRDWIEAYGRPEYAEYQKVALSDPFYPYEIRLYYIEGRKYVAFGRVDVSPTVRDFGVRKYIGKLDSQMLSRLLTARPLDEAAAAMAPEPQPVYGAVTYTAPEPEAEPEEAMVEEVVEIVSPEEVVVGEVAEAPADPAPEEAVDAVEEVIVIDAPEPEN
jgi:hypothetical protein